MMGVVALSSVDGKPSADISADGAPDAQADSSANANPMSDYPWLDDDGNLLDFRSMLESYRKNADSISYRTTSRYTDAGVGFGITYATHDTTLTIRAVVSDYGIANYEFEEGSFQALVIPEMQLSTNYGMPALPYEKMLFSIPSGVEVINVRAYSRSSESLFGLNVVPGPKPVAMYGFEVPDTTLYFNPDAYSSTNMLPSQLVESEIVQQGSERALMITLHPLQYNPSLKQGLLHDEIVIDVRFTSPITYEGVTFYGWSDFQGANYTIITTSEFLPVLADFINWKTALGFTVQYETIDDILSSYPGRDNPEKVRSFVSAAFYENRTEYFLLVGDCDIVPVREVVDPAAGPGLDNGTEPSDLYYECLDGSWDANGNDAFGELTDEVDLFPEVKVGRLPVQTPAEAQAALMHIISYESDPEPGDWLNDFMLIAVDCFGYGDGVVMSEGEINQKYLFDSFFNVFRYYPTDLSLSTPDIVAKMNSGINIVNFFDHGAYDVWYSALAVSDVLGLTNGNKSFFAFAMACETAAFDVEEVEPTIGEAFFRNLDGGSSTYIGATRVAWAGYDCFDGYHNAFWDYFLTEALSSHEARPKEAFHAAIDYMATTFDTTNAPTLESIYQAIYFGDPSLTLYWKHNVTTITAPVEVNENVVLNGTCLTYNNRPIADSADITVTDPLGAVVYSDTVATDAEGRYSVQFIASAYPGDYSVQTHIMQPFAYTADTSFAVGTLDMTLQLDGVPVYNTNLGFSGTVGDDCDGFAILLDSTGGVIANISLASTGGIFAGSVNTTGFGWLSLYVQFGNGTATGGAEIEFQVIRGEILIIADNAGTTYGPEYPGGWADDNFGDGSNPGDYVLALQDEYEVSVFFTMHNSTPSISLLNSYDAVIVSTGDNYGYPLNAPASYLLDVLYEYHIGGGPLLFEGGSILYSLASSESARFSALFHVGFIERTVNSGALELVKSSHPLMSGLPTSVPLAAGLGSAYADVFAPANGSYHAAEYGGDYIGGTAISGLAPSAALGGVVFIGFSIDAIVDRNQRDMLIQNALAFLLHPSLMVTLTDDALKSGTSEMLFVEVTNSATGTPVRNADVVFEGCGVSASNTTEPDGTCSVLVSPTSEGLIEVNVTKSGFLNFSTYIIVYNQSIIELTASPDHLERSIETLVTITSRDYYEHNPLEDCLVNVTGLGNSFTGFTNESGMVGFLLLATIPGIVHAEGSLSGYISSICNIPVRLNILILPGVGATYYDECCWDELMLNWADYGEYPLHIDYTTFQNTSNVVTLDLLEELNPDVLCLGFPLSSLTSAAIDAIKSYVTAGHGFVMDSGAMYYNALDWEGFFGLTDLGTLEGASANIEIRHLYPSHPLFIGVSDPYISSYPMAVYPQLTGWDSTKLLGASYVGLEDSGLPRGAIITYRGMVYMTSIPEYMSNRDDCQILYNAFIWSDYFIPDHELAISLDVPSRVDPGVTTTIAAAVINSGLFTETDVVVHLYIDSLQVDNYTIPSLPSGSSAILEYEWTVNFEGFYNITAAVDAVPGESDPSNNIVTKVVAARLLIDYIMTEDEFTWYDAMGNGVSLPITGDDEYGSVALPFSFRYYDGVYDNVHISSNGWLSFTNPYPSDFSNVEFPSTNSRYAYAVAPMWADLYAESNIYYWGTEDWVVIEYNDYDYLGGSLVGTYEVVFFADGHVAFNYLNMGDIYDGTVGLNHGDGIHYNAYPSGLLTYTMNFSLAFRYIVPEHDLCAGLISPEYAIVGESAELIPYVRNAGNSTETNVELILYIDYEEVTSVLLTSLGSLETFEYPYSWIPSTGGYHDITVIVTPVANESSTVNNVLSREIYVSGPRDFEITSPTEGQTIEGGLVYVEFESSTIYEINYILVYVNDELLFYDNQPYLGEIAVPVFENGTNIILLEVYWSDSAVSSASVEIVSSNVAPLFNPQPDDYYDFIMVSDYFSYEINFTFGAMVNDFDVEVEIFERIMDDTNTTVDTITYNVLANILNGYISTEPMRGARLFFLTGIQSPTTTGSSAEIGDRAVGMDWYDIHYVNSSGIWEGYAVWQSISIYANTSASIFRSNAILATYEYVGSGMMGWVVDTSFFPAIDTSPPVWLTPLEDITAEAGEFFAYQIDVYDDSGIDLFTVNSTLFSLALSGLLTNVVRLHVAIYNLEIVASDPFGHELTGHLSVFVEDTTPPDWIDPPGDLTIDFGEILLVSVDAEDFSGIDHWSVNSTRFIVTAQGVLTSIVQLQPGVYWLNVSVYDIYDNMNTMILSVTVLGSGQPLDMILVVWVGSMTAIAVGGFVVAMMRRRTRRGV